MANKVDNVIFFNDFVASDLLDSHGLGNDKLCAPAMERSHRSSLDANSVDVSFITLNNNAYTFLYDLLIVYRYHVENVERKNTLITLIIQIKMAPWYQSHAFIDKTLFTSKKITF